jgi:TonB family protein
MDNGMPSSGIFSYKHTSEVGVFPRDLRRGLFARVDPGYTGLFLALLLIISITVWVLSLRNIKEEALSAQEIQKIQERYAQLMLNQPKEKVVPKEQPIERKMREVEGRGVKGGAQVNREKESYAEREARRKAGSGSRAEARAAVEREVEGSGIFAAITANSANGAGAKEGVDDLLGRANVGLSDVGSMSFSKSSFASARAGGGSFSERTDGRVGNVDIERQQLGRARAVQVATAGTVNFSSAAQPEITGESAGLEARSQEAIGRVEKREESRLKRVFEEWLKRDPQLSGNLTIKFTILPDGSVSNVVIVKSTIDNSDFSETIVRYIMRWQFSPVDGGGPVEVTYPFVFEGHA